MKNIGNATLLLGMTWFGFTYGFSWWIIALMILATGTWSYYTITDEQKDLLFSQIRLNAAKTEYYLSRIKEDYKK